MKNLKRILSLALAGTMLVGMMVVGASAAEYADQDAIDPARVSAVETLKALEVMVGYNGTDKFNPNGNLTRAQMAKIIAVVHRGQDDIEDLIPATSATSFSDVESGKWYVPYIEYCNIKGLINGYPGGTFGPGNTLNATDAARMVLNLMGYTWQDAGSTYAVATALQANDNHLFDNLKGVLGGKTISRENVAQVVVNAITQPLADAETTKVPTWKVIDTSDNNALLAGGFTSRSEALIYAALVKGNGVTPDVVEGDAKEETKTLASENLKLTTINKVMNKFEYNPTSKKYEASLEGEVKAIEVDADYSALIGKPVSVLKKDGKVISIVPATTTVLYTGLVKDITARASNGATITIGGETFACDSYAITQWNTTTKVSVGNNGSASGIKGWWNLTVYDDNGDEVIDRMVAQEVKVDQIADVDDDGIVTIKNHKDSDGDLIELDPAKNNLPEGLKKNDWVAYTLNTGTGYVSAEKLTKIENVRYTKIDEDGSHIIGGVSYLDSDNAIQTLGAAYDLVAYKGYVFNMTKVQDATVTASVGDVVLITQFATTANGLPAPGTNDEFGAGAPSTQKNGDTYTGNVYLVNQENGKVEKVTVAKINGNAPFMYLTQSGAATKDPNGIYGSVTKDDVYPATAFKGTEALFVVTKTNDDGSIEIYSMTEALKNQSNGKPMLDVDTSAKTGSDADIKVGADGQLDLGNDTKVRLNANGVFFVKYDTGEKDKEQKAIYGYMVATGADVAGWEWKGLTTTGSAASVYTKKGSDGFTYAALGLLTLAKSPVPVADPAKYGYVTAATTTEYLWAADGEVETDGTYYRVTIWTGEGEKSADYLLSADPKVSKGDFVTFEVAKGKILKGAPTKLTPTVDAISALTSTEFETATGITGKIADLRDVIYIDYANKAGATGEGLKRADGYNNIFVYRAKDGYVLFVDVKNKINIKVTESTEAAKNAKDEDIKKLKDGVYTPADKDFKPGDVAGEAKDNRIFKFTTEKATTKVTLSIKDVNGNEMMPGGKALEFTGLKWSLNDAEEGHYFYVHVYGTAGNPGNDPDLSAGGTYTVTIKDADNNITLFSASINVEPKAAQ